MTARKKTPEEQHDAELEAQAQREETALPQTVADDSRIDTPTVSEGDDTAPDTPAEDYPGEHTSDGETPIAHRGGPASRAGTSIQESSARVRREGMTGTQETMLSQGVPVTPYPVDHDKAAADEWERQRNDDERRQQARKAEELAAEAAEQARIKASPQYDADGNVLYDAHGNAPEVGEQDGYTEEQLQQARAEREDRKRRQAGLE